jgi:hypothetical protein
MRGVTHRVTRAAFHALPRGGDPAEFPRRLHRDAAEQPARVKGGSESGAVGAPACRPCKNGVEAALRREYLLSDTPRRDGGLFAPRGLVPSNGALQAVLDIHSRFDVGSSTPSLALVPVLRSSIVEENDEIGTAELPRFDRPGACGDGRITFSIATDAEVIGEGRRFNQN